MKKVTVNAVVPENKEKGVKGMQAAVVVNFPESIEEAKKVGYTDEVILSNALANWKVTIQNNIRSALKRGEAPAAIAARLAGAKMGVAQTGAKVDPVQAYLAQFAAATPEDQKKMLAELQARAAKK